MILKNSSRCLTSWQSVPSASSSLNSKMKRFIDSRRYKEALNIFKTQRFSSYNNTTCTLALKACANLKDYTSGIYIHQKLSSKSLENSFVQASLIIFYSKYHLFIDARHCIDRIKYRFIFASVKCRVVEQAEVVFSSVKKKSPYVFAAMFKGYIENNRPDKVLELFGSMPVEIDEVIAVLLFNACAKIPNDHAMKIGRDVLNRIPVSFLQNQILVNSVIDMMMKFGDVSKAEDLFHKSPKKTIVTYGAMMQGYATNNLFDKALDLFREMRMKPDGFLHSIAFSACASLLNDQSVVIGRELFDKMPKSFYHSTIVINSALHMFMAFGEIQTAERLFSQMEQKDAYTYSIMMNGYKANQDPEKCLSTFQQLKQTNMKIHGSVWVSLLGACSQIGMLSVAEDVARQISSTDLTLLVKSALIDTWGKCGSVKKAEDIFQSIFQPDIVAFSSMVNVYARNGMGYEAIDLYNRIPERTRNDVSHICVLNACSHSGLIDQAQIIFSKIPQKSKEIITVMVDCLSRMAMFDEAQKLIDDYEKHNSPYLIMYMAMLSAARNHCNVDLSEKIYDRIKLMFPDEKSHLISGSILLANTYASLGDTHKVQIIRSDRIKQYGANVKAGMSWTEVDGQLVKFKAHDRSHPQSDEIYAELERLSNELKDHNHVYDSSWITRPLNDEETIESVLCGHSEKLAIAFNFIQHRRPSVIQISKNLRVCGDCHRATKLIAKIRQCQIIVRDANRIHHFETNGQCSCQDHF